MGIRCQFGQATAWLLLVSTPQLAAAQALEPARICLGAEALPINSRIPVLIEYAEVISERDLSPDNQCCPAITTGNSEDRVVLGTQLARAIGTLMDARPEIAASATDLVRLCNDRIVMAAYFALMADSPNASTKPAVLWKKIELIGNDSPS